MLHSLENSSIWCQMTNFCSFFGRFFRQIYRGALLKVFSPLIVNLLVFYVLLYFAH